MVTEIISGRDLTELDESIKRVRADYPDWSYEDIAVEVGTTKSNVNHRIKVMLKNGEIEPKPRKKKVQEV